MLVRTLASCSHVSLKKRFSLSEKFVREMCGFVEKLGATGTRSPLDGGGLASQIFAVCFGTVKADMLNK